MQKISTVLVTDFDGTITKKDFFHHVIDKLLEEGDLAPWKDYESGIITHFEALNRIFQKIRLSKEALHEFILELPVEECFMDTVDFCRGNSIDIYIVSAGADYYIKYILERLGVTNHINLITNKSDYNPDTGLQMFKVGEDFAFYSNNYGVDKRLVVEHLKNSNKTVVYAGDGVPDYKAAKLADVVFARGQLLDLCRENSVKAYELDSYCSVLEYLKDNNK